MTLPEDRLTAYALNDPGLTPEERAAIDTHLAADPAARQAVEETRRLGALLTTSLTREQVTLTADVAPTPAKRPRRWPAYVGGLASGAALTLAVAAGVTTLDVGRDSKPPTVAAAPASQQEAVRLRFLQSFSYREIAGVMGLTESHVGVLLHTAIKTLRQTCTPAAPEVSS